MWLCSAARQLYLFLVQYNKCPDMCPYTCVLIHVSLYVSYRKHRTLRPLTWGRTPAECRGIWWGSVWRLSRRDSHWAPGRGHSCTHRWCTWFPWRHIWPVLPSHRSLVTRGRGRNKDGLKKHMKCVNDIIWKLITIQTLLIVSNNDKKNVTNLNELINEHNTNNENSFTLIIDREVIPTTTRQSKW